MLREWKAATDRNHGMGRTFIVPLVVDDAYAPEAYKNKWVRQWGSSEMLDFGHAPAGVPDERLRETLIRLIRAARSRTEPAVV